MTTDELIAWVSEQAARNIGYAAEYENTYDDGPAAVSHREYAAMLLSVENALREIETLREAARQWERATKDQNRMAVRYHTERDDLRRMLRAVRRLLDEVLDAIPDYIDGRHDDPAEKVADMIERIDATLVAKKRP